MSLKTYQWLKGDRAGEVVKSDGGTLLEGNLEFLIFTDGSRCNTTLLGDYIMEIASDGEEDLILMNDPAPQPMQRVEAPKPTPQPVKVENAPKSLSPLETLLSTSKKVKEKVTITFEIEVPPADLLKVVASSFDNGEKQVFDYLTNGWTSEQTAEIKKQVGEYLMTSIFGKPQTTKKRNEKV